MPVPVSAGDVWEMKVITESRGQEGITTFHHLIRTPVPGGCSSDDLFEGWNAQRTLFLAIMTDIAFYRGLTLQKLYPGPKSVLLEMGLALIAGTAGSAPIPAQAAAIIAKKTQLSGPRNRGRVFLPFLDQGLLDPTNAQMGATGLLRMGAIASTFIGAFTLTPAIGPIPVTPLLAQKLITPDLWPVVTDTTSRSKIGTQKRRGDYGRLNAIPI